MNKNIIDFLLEGEIELCNYHILFLNFVLLNTTSGVEREERLKNVILRKNNNISLKEDNNNSNLLVLLLLIYNLLTDGNQHSSILENKS